MNRNILRIFVIMRIYNSEYRTIKYCLIIFLSMILLTGCHTVKPASVPKPTDGFYSGDFAGRGGNYFVGGRFFSAAAPPGF